ncbi:MAG TPA: amidohydrolase family protein [Vicinamibacterales bacterium]|nr:amidohydrolase family protein [Vicinamibacterales bacterium]
MCNPDELTRRGFLTLIAGTASLTAIGSQNSPIPIIDTHIHLFDPTRPQGAPYTGPPGVPVEPSLPPRYRKLATPLGIVGAIKVEASPWVEDNLWVLEVAERDTIVVGVVGNLEPDKPDFAEMLERYRKNRLFRGIRYGNLWGRDITKQVDNPPFIDGLKRLQQADLVLDTANPRVDLLQAMVKLTDKVPDLRVVLDHLPSLEPTATTRKAYDETLDQLQQRPRVFVKLSAVIHRVNGQVSTELNAYRDRLQQLVARFGEDRILFGSDWPNSDGVAPLDKVVGIVREFFQMQPREVAEKYFWKNSLAAYKWIKRDPVQPAM